MATTRNIAVREALTFEKYTHSSCFLFLQCLALDKSLHLHCLLKHLYILICSQKLYRPTNMYIVFAYLRNRIGKNMVKDSVEASCQMSVVVSLLFNSRRPDTMFSNWAIKCSSLVLQTVFLESHNKITFILERREEKKKGNTKCKSVPSMAWSSYRASLINIPICEDKKLIFNDCTYLICCINKFDSFVRDRQDNGWHFLHLFCRLLKQRWSWSYIALQEQRSFLLLTKYFS